MVLCSISCASNPLEDHEACFACGSPSDDLDAKIPAKPPAVHTTGNLASCATSRAVPVSIVARALSEHSPPKTAALLDSLTVTVLVI